VVAGFQGRFQWPRGMEFCRSWRDERGGAGVYKEGLNLEKGLGT
jgi:hypothetical protein